jgi:hypothetical protein
LLVLISELLRFFIGNDLKGVVKYILIIVLYCVLIIIIRIMVMYLLLAEHSEMAISYFFAVPELALFIIAYILV